ncbi:hypothetical protein CKA32_005090 [Geitlerinema sp. FC II]|nr:hypothetical protein CKA32_005090 [Geitlerinema sp. FC II]
MYLNCVTKLRQKGNGERRTGNQIFSGVLIFDDSFGTAI